MFINILTTVLINVATLYLDIFLHLYFLMLLHYVY
jgi:hypothetical protein